MSKWIVAIIPFDGVGPKILPNIDTLVANGRVSLTRSGKRFIFKELPDEGQQKKRELRSLLGRYLGRLGEGVMGTTGQPAVVVCTASKTAFSFLSDAVSGNDDYDFMSLENAWKIAVARNWLKANGMPWITGEFGPVPGSTYGRPTLPVVYGNQPHDVFAPKDE